MKNKLGDWAVTVLYWGLLHWVLLLRRALAWAIVYPPCWSMIKVGQWHRRALDLKSQALWQHPPDLRAAGAAWWLAVVTAALAVPLGFYVGLLEDFARLTRGILVDLSERSEGDARSPGPSMKDREGKS